MSRYYDPESYWSEVGEKIEGREKGNVIAGDDEPFYRYKREKFLEMLKSIDLMDKKVLEVGSGPGGNLKFIIEKMNPAQLVGADISETMVHLAKKYVNPVVEIFKSEAKHLPFEDEAFDIVFTATVLQHNTDEKMLINLINEICRVSSEKVYIFEHIEPRIMGDELRLGRPVNYYSDLFRDNQFGLIDSRFINIRSSYYVSRAIRKLLNPKTRKEGEPLNKVSESLQRITLPVTKFMDNIFKSSRGLGMLTFQKQTF